MSEQGKVILNGTGPLCARCMQHESNHAPGPPSPPLIRGYLGATKDRPYICNDFKADAPADQEDTYA